MIILPPIYIWNRSCHLPFGLQSLCNSQNVCEPQGRCSFCWFLGLIKKWSFCVLPSADSAQDCERFSLTPVNDLLMVRGSFWFNFWFILWVSVRRSWKSQAINDEPKSLWSFKGLKTWITTRNANIKSRLSFWSEIKQNGILRFQLSRSKKQGRPKIRPGNKRREPGVPGKE